MASMRIALTGLITAGLALMGTISASADTDPYGEHSSGGPYATCNYQRWYPGAEACGGSSWTISIAAECANTKVYYNGWWRTDSVCQSLVVKAAPVVKVKPVVKASHVVVRRGDTLWRIAIRAYGGTAHAGQQYRTIMRLNHLHSTRIHAGQVLQLR